jgi:hypothetical protein
MSNAETESARDFGNEQDMSVHDKNSPTLGPTEGSQDVATLNRIVVPPGAYTDPNNPSALSNSVNLTIDKTPTPVSEDYGLTQLDEAGVGEHPVEGTIGVHADAVGRTSDAEGAQAVELPENRDDWQKAHWQQQARAFGLPVSGNMDALQSRVEEHEQRVEAAKSFDAEDWKDQIAAADDLTDLRNLYTASGASYSTVESAFDARQAELDES